MDEPVYLRPLEMDDLDRIHKWHNDERLYGTLLGQFRHVSRATAEEWLRKKTAYLPNEVNLAICVASDSTHIGNIYLRDIDWLSRRGEVHFFIGERGDRNRGFGRAALRLLIRHAFVDLGLLRMYAYTLADNVASVRMMERCGFSAEGTLRKHFFKAGKLRDGLIMGLTADDWLENQRA